MTSNPAPLARALRDALSTGDRATLEALMARDLLWSPSPDLPPQARDAHQVLSWLEGLKSPTDRPSIEETFIYPDAVVLALTTASDQPGTRYLVFLLRGDHVTQLRGFGERGQALEAALVRD